MQISIILQVVVLAVVVVTSVHGHQEQQVLFRETGNNVQVSRNLRSQVFDLDVFEQQIADLEKKLEIDEKDVANKIKELEQEINELGKETQLTKAHNSRQVKLGEKRKRDAQKKREKYAIAKADALMLRIAKAKQKAGEVLTKEESNVLAREEELTTQEVKLKEKQKRDAEKKREKYAIAKADALTLRIAKAKQKAGEALTPEESNVLAREEEVTNQQVKLKEDLKRDAEKKREKYAIAKADGLTLRIAKAKEKAGEALTTEESNVLAREEEVTNQEVKLKEGWKRDAQKRRDKQAILKIAKEKAQKGEVLTKEEIIALAEEKARNWEDLTTEELNVLAEKTELAKENTEVEKEAKRVKLRESWKRSNKKYREKSAITKAVAQMKEATSRPS